MGKSLTYLAAVLVVGGVFAGTIYFLKPYLSSYKPSGQKVEKAEEKTATPSPETTPTTLPLQITSPQDGATVTSAKLTLKGKTAPGAEVFVNEAETKADSAGDFSLNLTLDEGENIIIVLVNDSEGQSAEKEIKINY